jgi:hypothetical protein
LAKTACDLLSVYGGKEFSDGYELLRLLTTVYRKNLGKLNNCLNATRLAWLTTSDGLDVTVSYSNTTLHHNATAMKVIQEKDGQTTSMESISDCTSVPLCIEERRPSLALSAEAEICMYEGCSNINCNFITMPRKAKVIKS